MTRRPPRSLVLVVMGVSGCGKSTVAAALADRLGWELAEGDDLHPAANVAKMSAGQPLTDADRRPWLQTIAAWIRAHTEAGRSAVVTCSALKRSYRDVLRDDDVVFVYLRASRELLAERLAARAGHYMPASLLDSQLETLEEPEPDERAITIDADVDPAAVERAVLTALARPVAPAGRSRPTPIEIDRGVDDTPPMTETPGYPCPCCGYRTLPEPSPSDDICPVCFWQDDFVDNHDTSVLGPNRVRLSIARENYARYGAHERRWVPNVRPPRPDEGPPVPWTERRDKSEL